jgi:hypothetical protein
MRQEGSRKGCDQEGDCRRRVQTNSLSFPCSCVETDYLDAPASSAGRRTVPDWLTTNLSNHINLSPDNVPERKLTGMTLDYDQWTVAVDLARKRYYFHTLAAKCSDFGLQGAKEAVSVLFQMRPFLLSCLPENVDNFLTKHQKSDIHVMELYRRSVVGELLHNSRVWLLVLVVENWRGRCANVVLPG